MTETLPEDLPIAAALESSEASESSESSDIAAVPTPAKARTSVASRIQGSLPTLEKLASLYPALFGAVFVPMKRGIFQDLLAAHPDTFERDALKAALSVHTRSTRYLTAVANGLARHDLQAVPVEAMAPEHIYQSLVEVFRRRKPKPGEDVEAKLRQRIAQAFVDSRLTREDYAGLVRGKDDATNAALDEALAVAADHDAKAEATRRAFTASGQTVEAFADMYGLHPRAVSDALARSDRWMV